MKKTLFFISILTAAMLMFTVHACKKETFIDNENQLEIVESKVEELYDFALDNDIPVTKAQIENAMVSEDYAEYRSSEECYTVLDLIGISSSYGFKVEYDYIPSWQNYFQDANCNVAKWTYYGHERNEDGTGSLSDIDPASVDWLIASISEEGEDCDSTAILLFNEDEIWFQTYDSNQEPNCGWFQPDCNGGHATTLTVTLEDGSVWSRSAIGYAGVNNTPDDICDCNYNSLDVQASFVNELGTFEPIIFDEYEFLIESSLPYDFDNSGTVDVLDFLVVSSNYCQ